MKKGKNLEKLSIGHLKKDSKGVTLYVGNLRYDKDERSLLKVFNKFGYVNFVRINRDRKTMRSTGIAFIQMADKKAGQEAIKTLDGTQFEGRTLKVSIAKENKKPQRKSKKRV